MPRTRQANQSTTTHPSRADGDATTLYRLVAGGFKHRGTVTTVDADGKRTDTTPRPGGTVFVEPGCLVRLRQLDVETLARLGHHLIQADDGGSP